MAFINHPVGYTCPEIDEAISIISDVSGNISSVADDLKEIVKEDWIDLLYTNASKLDDLVFGSRSKLEKLRESNDTLRKWGDNLVTELDEARKDLEWTQAQVETLKDQIEDLKEELQYAINN